jgi:hypothetical protein
MEFFVTDNSLREQATLEVPIIDGYFTDYYFRHFDNDGFQLNRLEQLYYEAQGIDIPECLGVRAAQYNWFDVIEPGKFIIDHSLLITRCAYVGRAREQLERMSRVYPYLKKYLLLKPKWGFDFALEYAGDEYLEVLHIEQDFDSYREALERKKHFEELVFYEDWEMFAAELVKHKAFWEPLQGMERNDWKARFWGFDKAERTLKAF